MFRILFLVSFIGSALTVYHTLFKKCSRIDFCSRLRNRTAKVNYKVTDNGISTHLVTLTLSPDDGSDNLELLITPLEGSVFRLQIAETDSKRYQLKDVLNGDPKVSKFTSTKLDTNSLTLHLSDGYILVTFVPFLIQVNNAKASVMAFHGDLLIMENTDSSQAFAFGLTYLNANQVVGIHEHADNFSLSDTDGSEPYRLKNLDVPNYETYSPMALYGAIPVLYGIGPSVSAGIFFHNAAEQWIDINNGKDVFIMAETGSLDLFVLLGPTPAEVIRQYVGLTGTAHLPQLWALGYHQCRWNYDNQSDVKDVVANFNNYNFQMDAIWLDIEYTDGKKYFTWNPENFTDPVEMQQNISATNRKLVTIIDPHIKVEKGYKVYDGALEKGLFVQNHNGTVFEGNCWPGLSSYMDFLNPKARAYYGSMYSYENFKGSTPVLAGIWNDMNEPSVDNDDEEKTMSGDEIHFGGVLHRDIHNIYGFLHTMSTHQGLMERDNGTLRPFILTRSHFAGSQRYTAIWTGDNTADWSYITVSYAQCLNANILGIVFCGADVGGFFGDEVDIELLQRWYQAGAWLTFYRAHANLGTKRREPYLYPEDVQKVIRNAIQIRYAHTPTFYNLFYEHTRFGNPVIRPLFYHYTDDLRASKINDQLLLGRDILVKPVTSPGVQNVSVYFPGGPTEYWLSLNTDDFFTGEGEQIIPVNITFIPVYYRAGSVIVRKDVVRPTTTDMINDSFDLHIILNKESKAHGTVYVDDYKSFNYRDNKEYKYLSIDADGGSVTLTDIDNNSNSQKFDFKVNTITYSTMKNEPRNGKSGTYTKIVYNKDKFGTSLNTLSFSKETSTIKLF